MGVGVPFWATMRSLRSVIEGLSASYVRRPPGKRSAMAVTSVRTSSISR